MNDGVEIVMGNDRTPRQGGRIGTPMVPTYVHTRRWVHTGTHAHAMVCACCPFPAAHVDLNGVGHHGAVLPRYGDGLRGHWEGSRGGWRGGGGAGGWRGGCGCGGDVDGDALLALGAV